MKITDYIRETSKNILINHCELNNLDFETFTNEIFEMIAIPFLFDYLPSNCSLIDRLIEYCINTNIDFTGLINRIITIQIENKLNIDINDYKKINFI